MGARQLQHLALSDVAGGRGKDAGRESSRPSARRRARDRVNRRQAAPQIRCAATLLAAARILTSRRCRRAAGGGVDELDPRRPASWASMAVAPMARAAATVSSGRRRLPPAETRCSASMGITGTSDCIRAMIRASTAAMSILRARRTRTSTSPLGRGAATNAASTKISFNSRGEQGSSWKYTHPLARADAAHNGGGVMTGQAGSTLTAAPRLRGSALL